MIYTDFASIVQLGVGLHVGTALLQVYGDVGLQPMTRLMDRINELVNDSEDPPPDCHTETFRQLSSEFGVYKIQMFQEYVKYLKINAAIAAMLTAILVYISFMAAKEVNIFVAIAVCVFSVVPGPFTLLLLWSRSERALEQLREKAKTLEGKLLVG